jgi:peptidoglycan/LPS O-acetylase OafA/YrhL
MIFKKIWSNMLSYMRKSLNKSSSMDLQIDSLDGLRGVAVLIVVVAHLSNNGFYLIPHANFSGVGKYGVFLFFVLSSFLLSLPFFSRKSDALLSREVWLNYGMRRFFRIYPLFTVVLVLSFVLTPLTGRFMQGKGFPYPISLDELFAHLALQQGKHVLWSIPVEFKYYFLLPLVVIFLARVLKANVWIGALFVALGVALCNALWPGSVAEIDEVALGPYLPIFLIGSLSALIHVRVSSSEFVAKKSSRNMMEIIALGAFAAIMLTTPAFYGKIFGMAVPKDYFHTSFILYGVLWSTFLVSYLNGSGMIRKLLSCTALRFIGVISFSCYLWHAPVLKVIKTLSHGSGSIFLGYLILITSLIVSVVSYRIFEKPFLRNWLQVFRDWKAIHVQKRLCDR